MRSLVLIGSNEIFVVLPSKKGVSMSDVDFGVSSSAMVVLNAPTWRFFCCATVPCCVRNDEKQRNSFDVIFSTDSTAATGISSVPMS